MNELLATFLLATHLIAMNLASAGPLVAIWLHVKAHYGNEAAHYAGRRLAGASVIALLLGMTLGGLLLVVIWDGSEGAYVRTLHRVEPSRYWFSAVELLLSLFALSLYWLCWARFLRCPWKWGLLAAFSSTNLLYHFPTLMSMISLLSSDPRFADVVLNRENFRKLVIDPEVASRVIHVWLASFAITGVWLIGVGRRMLRLDYHREAAPRIVIWGARIALLPTIIQLLVGLWLVLSSSESIQYALMGSDWIATLLLSLSILGTFWLLHDLFGLSMGDVRQRPCLRVMIVMALLVFFMSGTLRRITNLSRTRNVNVSEALVPCQDGRTRTPAEKVSGGVTVRSAGTDA